MMTRRRFALFAAALAVASAPRADTIQTSSTTMLNAGQDYRAGNVQTAVPAYEMVDISATDVKTPYTDNLEITLSTWGAFDAGNNVRFWQNGALATDNRLSGDINLAFVRADFFDRTLTLRVGRQMVADGVARMLQIDGGELELKLPAGFGVSGYAGTPVQPRFQALGGPYTVGNTEATFVTGSRVFWRYPGLLDVGTSVAIATDRGDVSRQDVGADFRFTPTQMLTFVGSGWWSLYEDRIGEASLSAIVSPVRQLDVTLDYRHVEPDLFLPRNSILAVFAADKRNDLGGAVHWGAMKNLGVDADYHVLLEEGAGTGHWARLKGTLHPGVNSTVGAEASYLHEPENGYTLARLFGSKTLQAITGTLDLYAYFFERTVNGEDKTLQATATLGYDIARGWRALVAGTAGATAYLSNQFQIMAKLVYNETYIAREVR